MTPKTREASANQTSGTSGGQSTELRRAAGEIASDVKETASHVADTAKRQVGRQVESQKERAAGGLGQMATALRQTSSQMREQESSTVPDYIEKAAEQVERVSGYLRDANVRDMIGSVERFARREPVLFIGGAFALGMLGARFLKASSPPPDFSRGQGYRERFDDRGYDDRRPGYGDAGSRGYGSQGYGDASFGYQRDAANNGGFDGRTTAGGWPPRQPPGESSSGAEQARAPSGAQAGGGGSSSSPSGGQKGTTTGSGERKTGTKGSL